MKAVSIGALNLDIIHQVPHIVQPGETLTSTSRTVLAGGKGLNQAVALRRAGLDVMVAGRIGRDGNTLVQYLESAGIDTSLVTIADGVTGYAVIQVEPQGENSIILHPGENRNLTDHDINQMINALEPTDAAFFQNEINRVPEIIDRAKKKGTTIILNPSPFDETISQINLRNVDYLFVNRLEGAALTNKSDPMEITHAILHMAPNIKVIVTLGHLGALYADSHETHAVTALDVDVKDSTGAGDTFLGYFMAEVLSTKQPLAKQPLEALQFASAASALAISREGAAQAIPTRAEVAHLQERGAHLQGQGVARF